MNIFTDYLVESILKWSYVVDQLNTMDIYTIRGSEMTSEWWWLHADEESWAGLSHRGVIIRERPTHWWRFNLEGCYGGPTQ